jgi:hypothetical protein
VNFPLQWDRAILWLVKASGDSQGAQPLLADVNCLLSLFTHQSGSMHHAVSITLSFEMKLLTKFKKGYSAHL